MRHLATAALVSFSPLLAQCDPLSLLWSPSTLSPFETATLRATGPVGTLAVIGFDEDGGPTIIPGIGTILLGFTPNFATVPVLIGPSGESTESFQVPCKQGAFAFHAQALTLAPTGFCLSNGARLQIQNLGACAPLNCLTESSVNSNFNGTTIAAGNWVWFNAIVRVGNVPPSGVIAAFRNAQIRFVNGGNHYVLPLPNATITFDPLAAAASTTYDGINGQFQTTVPASFHGNVFLSGLAFQVPVALTGGINPVTWTGEFTSLQGGLSYQWKWAAAVYTSFSGDYNALCVKPIDGSTMNPFSNSDHAGTPECWKSYVTGGARGGGGSNFTGSYSGTETAVCQ